MRGLEKGVHLGVRGGDSWECREGEEEAGKWIRLHQCKGGRRNKESVLGRVMEMGRGWMGDSGRGMMLFEIECLVVDWDVR